MADIKTWVEGFLVRGRPPFDGRLPDWHVEIGEYVEVPGRDPVVLGVKVLTPDAAAAAGHDLSTLVAGLNVDAVAEASSLRGQVTDLTAERADLTAKLAQAQGEAAALRAKAGKDAATIAGLTATLGLRDATIADLRAASPDPAAPVPEPAPASA